VHAQDLAQQLLVPRHLPQHQPEREDGTRNRSTDRRHDVFGEHAAAPAPVARHNEGCDCETDTQQRN